MKTAVVLFALLAVVFAQSSLISAVKRIRNVGVYDRNIQIRVLPVISERNSAYAKLSDRTKIVDPRKFKFLPVISERFQFAHPLADKKKAFPLRKQKNGYPFVTGETATNVEPLADLEKQITSLVKKSKIICRFPRLKKIIADKK
jgi:hypothetical protein